MLATTIPFHLAGIEDEVFRENEHTTKCLNRQFGGLEVEDSRESVGRFRYPAIGRN